MPRRATAIVALMLVMIVWGSSFAVTKASLAALRVPPILFALIRFTIASSTLLAMAGVQRRRGALGPAPAWHMVALIGLMGVTLYYVATNLALFYATASQGALIQSAIPAVTALMAVVLLKERMWARQAAGIGLSIAGVLVVVSNAPAGGTARNPLLGAALMSGSVVVWALYTVLAKQVAQADPFLVTAYSAVLGTLFLAPAALLESWGRPLPAIGPSDWAGLLYLGTVSSAVGYLIYNWSLRQLNAGQTANFVNVMPIAGVVIAILFLGEPVVPVQLIGGAIVLMGVWLAT